MEEDFIYVLLKHVGERFKKLDYDIENSSLKNEKIIASRQELKIIVELIQKYQSNQNNIQNDKLEIAKTKIKDGLNRVIKDDGSEFAHGTYAKGFVDCTTVILLILDTLQKEEISNEVY